MFKWLFHILIFATKPLKRQRKLGLEDYVVSALDKLLGQLGIYATWLSSIGYLQKQLRIFLRHIFFFCNYTFFYCMKPSEMCLHIYSLPSPAFLKYQTSGFYCTWSKSHPLVDTLQKFHFHHSVFPRNSGLGTDIFLKLELY